MVASGPLPGCNGRAVAISARYPGEPYCTTPKNYLVFVSEYFKYIYSLFKDEVFHRSSGFRALMQRALSQQTVSCNGLARN